MPDAIKLRQLFHYIAWSPGKAMRLGFGAGIAAVACWMTGSAVAQPASYIAGQADRTAYESWFVSLSGDMRSGVEYWAGQRSLSRPGSCFGPGGQTLGAWTQGCIEAQRRFGPIDIRRKNEPDYKAGWNSLPASTPPGPTMPGSYGMDEAARAALARAEAEQARRASLAAAETSPDNLCRKPDFARSLISEMNDFDFVKNAHTKVLDIEHLITVTSDQNALRVVCHGTFVFDSGVRLTGNFEMKPNVAGDMLSYWRPDPR